MRSVHICISLQIAIAVGCLDVGELAFPNPLPIHRVASPCCFVALPNMAGRHVISNRAMRSGQVAHMEQGEGIVQWGYKRRRGLPVNARFSLPKRGAPHRPSKVAMQLSSTPSGDSGKNSSPCGVAMDLGQALKMCSTALTNAVQSGQRGLTVDILTPDLNPSSRGYDRANLHSLCTGMAINLRKLVAGDVMFVMHDKKEADSAKEAFGMSISLAADWAEELVTVSSLEDPPPTTSPDVLVLVAPTNTKERKVTKEVRDLLKSSPMSIVIVVNQALDTPGPPDGRPVGELPVEILRMESAFFLEPFALQARSGPSAAPPRPSADDTASEGSADGEAPTTTAPAPLRITLTHAYPGGWGVWRFEEKDQVYVLEKDFGSRKPSKKLMLDVAGDIVKRKAARD